jgi:hypothetical protein
LARVCRALQLMSVRSIAHSSAWIATMVAVLLATSPAGAERQERFRSGVALLELNVGVLDAEGQPVPDLRAQDFDVRVGGRERKGGSDGAHRTHRHRGNPASWQRLSAEQAEASIARTGEPDRCVILGALHTRGLEPGVYVLSMSMRSGAAETTVSGYLRIAAPE